MAPFILPAVTAAGTVYGAIQSARNAKKAGNARRQAIAELRAAQPTGYLTPADYRAAEQTRGRLGAAATASGTLAGYEVSRRARARGLAGSPSEERDQARVQQQVALGRENAGNAAEEQLYNMRTGREQFGQQKELAIFGANVNAATNEQARLDAQQGEYWNSLNGVIGGIVQSIPGGNASGGVTYSPNTPGFNPTGPGVGPPAPRLQRAL